MPKKGVSRKGALQRRQVSSTARAARVDWDRRRDRANLSEPTKSRPIWEAFDVKVSVVAKGTQTQEVEGQIGDLRPPPTTAVRRRKPHATFRQWISYASHTRKAIVALHGMLEALKRMFGG